MGRTLADTLLGGDDAGEYDDLLSLAALDTESLPDPSVVAAPLPPGYAHPLHREGIVARSRSRSASRGSVSTVHDDVLVQHAADRLRSLPRASVLSDAVNTDLVNRVYTGIMAYSPRDTNPNPNKSVVGRELARQHVMRSASPVASASVLAGGGAAKQSSAMSPPLPADNPCPVRAPPAADTPLLQSPVSQEVAAAQWVPGQGSGLAVDVMPTITASGATPHLVATPDTASRRRAPDPRRERDIVREISPRRPAHASTTPRSPHRDPTQNLHTTERTRDAVALAGGAQLQPEEWEMEVVVPGGGPLRAASPYRSDQEVHLLRRALEDAKREIETLREEARLGQTVGMRYKEKAEGLAVRLQQAAEGAEIWKARVDEMVVERRELTQARDLAEAKVERMETEAHVLLIEREKMREVVGSLADVERQREELREKERGLKIKSSVHEGLYEKTQQLEEQLATAGRAMREKDKAITDLQAALVLSHTDMHRGHVTVHGEDVGTGPLNAAGGVLTFEEEMRLTRSHQAALKEILQMREGEARVRLETARALFVVELRHLATAADAERFRTLYQQERGANKQELSDRLASVGEAKARAEAVAKQLESKSEDLEKQLASVTSKYLYGTELSESELECLREQNRLLREHVDRAQERLLAMEGELTKANQKIADLRNEAFKKETEAAAERLKALQQPQLPASPLASFTASPTAAATPTATPPSYRATPQSAGAGSRRRSDSTNTNTNTVRRTVGPHSPQSQIRVVSIAGPNQSVGVDSGRHSATRAATTPSQRLFSSGTKATPDKSGRGGAVMSMSGPVASRSSLQKAMGTARGMARRTPSASPTYPRSHSAGGHWVPPPARSSPPRNRSMSPRRAPSSSARAPLGTGTRSPATAPHAQHIERTASTDTLPSSRRSTIDAGDEHTPGSYTAVQRAPETSIVRTHTPDGVAAPDASVAKPLTFGEDDL